MSLVQSSQPERYTKQYTVKKGQLVRIDGAWCMMVENADVLAKEDMTYDGKSFLRREDFPGENESLNDPAEICNKTHGDSSPSLPSGTTNTRRD